MSGTTFLLLISAASLAVVAALAFRHVPAVVRVLRNGRRAKGQIVRDDTVFTLYGRLHFPVVMFRDDSGVMHEVCSRFERATSAREQMSEVEIAYLQEDPKGTAVLVGARYYLPTAMNASVFLLLGVGFPVAFWLIAK